MQQRQSHSTNIDLEPIVGDVVRVTGNEWLGHPMMAAIGLVIDSQDRPGEPVEHSCLVLFSNNKLWIYISDLTVVCACDPHR